MQMRQKCIHYEISLSNTIQSTQKACFFTVSITAGLIFAICHSFNIKKLFLLLQINNCWLFKYSYCQIIAIEIKLGDFCWNLTFITFFIFLTVFLWLSFILQSDIHVRFSPVSDFPFSSGFTFSLQLPAFTFNYHSDLLPAFHLYWKSLVILSPLPSVCLFCPCCAVIFCTFFVILSYWFMWPLCFNLFANGSYFSYPL